MLADKVLLKNKTKAAVAFASIKSKANFKSRFSLSK
jgi:hypothetical protein